MSTYDAMLSTERLRLPSPVPITTLLDGKVVESERLEFKRGWNPLSTLHTLCAFANDFHNLGGGYVFIGIAAKDGVPQRPAVGLDLHEIDSIQKEILRLGYEAMRRTIILPSHTARLTALRCSCCEPTVAAPVLTKRGSRWLKMKVATGGISSAKVRQQCAPETTTKRN